MKIGIIANHRAQNYGTVLQTYALFTVLKNKGYNVEIIDYWPNYKRDQYSLFRFSSYLHSKDSAFSILKIWIKRTVSFPERLIRYAKFNFFINQQFKFSRSTYRNGKKISDKYDVIIFEGEIWKYQLIRKRICFDEVYVGKYPNNSRCKKIAYAASTGTEEMNKYALDKLAQYLENFKHVSVREEVLLNQLEQASTKQAQQVLDPVFLLQAEHWENLIKKDGSKEKYLLFYQQMKSNEAAKLAKKIAAEKGLKVIEIRGYISRPLLHKKIKTTAGPIDFLTLIAKADYVVSTSFHGVAFAIIFGKQFSALGFKNNGFHVRGLLKMLGVDKNIVQKDLDDYYDGVDYASVHSRLNRLRKESLGYLFSSIAEGNTKVKEIAQDLRSEYKILN